MANFREAEKNLQLKQGAIEIPISSESVEIGNTSSPSLLEWRNATIPSTLLCGKSMDCANNRKLPSKVII
jgi:hypothetical protein